jgi:hypothetical protein
MKFNNELLKTNVNSDAISEDILLYGSCISTEYKEILGQFKQGTFLHVCLEKEHVNQAAWKIQTIVRVNKPKKIAVLTIAGSPHCIQLHHALEDVKKIFPALQVKHYVIEKGKLIEVTAKAVRISRHLNEVEGMLK